MQTSTFVPNTSELFNKHQLVERHSHLLTEHRLAWALRNRARNGLAAAGAVYDSPCGELILHEPSVIAWLLGRAGRAKPRASTRRVRA